MDPTAWLAVAVVVAAVAAVVRGLDVRLVLFTAALLLGGIAGNPAPVVREFLATFSSEKFVVPICSAMGFAYVLRHTGCDRDLVQLLVEPVRRVKPLMIPGVVLIGFVVNIPVISQTSTAVCLGTVVVPVMRAAGFSALAIGGALLLGASVGGELLNPGAPELLTMKEVIEKDKARGQTFDTREAAPHILPLLLPVLAVSGVVLWAMTVRGERKAAAAPDAEARSPEAEEPAHPRINPFRAMVPLVPLVLLFVSGPPLDWLQVPSEWVVNPPDPKTYSTRLIGLAMLVGVGVAAVAAPRRAGGCMRAFFDGAGYGFTHIISLIVTANCFGKGIEVSGLATVLGDLIAGTPGLLVPLAGLVPAAFGFVCGSGMASTQSLYGFFYAPTVEVGGSPTEVGAMVSVASAAGRTMSPVAVAILLRVFGVV